MGAAFAFHQSFRHVNLVDKQDELTIINLGNLNLWKIFADLNSMENFRICIYQGVPFDFYLRIFQNIGRVIRITSFI